VPSRARSRVVLLHPSAEPLQVFENNELVGHEIRMNAVVDFRSCWNKDWQDAESGAVSEFCFCRFFTAEAVEASAYSAGASERASMFVVSFQRVLHAVIRARQ